MGITIPYWYNSAHPIGISEIKPTAPLANVLTWAMSDSRATSSRARPVSAYCAQPKIPGDFFVKLKFMGGNSKTKIGQYDLRVMAGCAGALRFFASNEGDGNHRR